MRPSRDTLNKPDGVTREPLWVESSEQKEAARALEMLHVQLISAVIDPYSWKWAIIMLHHAVQGFVVASLGGESTGGSPETRVSGPILNVHYRDAERYHEARSDYLPELYDRMKQVTGYTPAEGVERDLGRLIECRSVLLQAIPSSWKLRVNEMPVVAQNCLKIVEFLGWSPGHIRWQRENLADLARVKFLASMKVLDALDGQYQT